MKISKLFHSLYALLMLAPVFAVGGAMAFNILNPNSVYHSDTNDIIYRSEPLYQTNEPQSNAELVVGNIYKLKVFDDSNGDELGFALNSQDIVSLFFDDCIYFYIGTDGSIAMSLDEILLSSDYSLSLSKDISLSYANDDTYYLYFGENFYPYFSNYYTLYIENFYYTTYFYVVLNADIYNLFSNNSYHWYEFFDAVPVSDIPLQYFETDLSSGENTFYKALNDVRNSPVFSWANNNFISEPFMYIFGLFGIASNSPFLTLLNYWLDISIIWLVFDLIMVVPLLVHSWIDKGVIE